MVVSRAALRRGAREWSPYNRRCSGKSANPTELSRARRYSGSGRAEASFIGERRIDNAAHKILDRPRRVASLQQCPGERHPVQDEPSIRSIAATSARAWKPLAAGDYAGLERPPRPGVNFRNATGGLCSRLGLRTYTDAASAIATGRLHGYIALPALGADFAGRPVLVRRDQV